MRNSNNGRMCRLEKNLIKICFVLLLMFPILNVVSKAALSDINLGVERIKREISTQSKTIESLNMKVDELKSMANLQTVIDSEGLTYNSSKIKVIASR